MKSVEDYLELPYSITLLRQQPPGEQVSWYARVPELPGCMSMGDTPNEAYEMIQEAMYLWIEVCLRDGFEVPLPAREAVSA